MSTTTIPAVGASPEPRTFGPLTRTDFVRYQGASGDFVPLHHDEGYAQKAGYPTVFSVGMLQAGFLGTFVTDWLGVDTIRRYSMRFVEQCWPDDVLTCTGTVREVVASADGTSRVTVDLLCTRQTGATAIAAVAEFELGAAR